MNSNMLFLPICSIWHGFPLTMNMTQAFAWVVSFWSGTKKRFNEETGSGKHRWKIFPRSSPRIEQPAATWIVAALVLCSFLLRNGVDEKILRVYAGDSGSSLFRPE